MKLVGSITFWLLALIVFPCGAQVPIRPPGYRRAYTRAAKDAQAEAELESATAAAGNDLQSALDEYALAFLLPESGPVGMVDHNEVRLKLGAARKQLHGDAPGLGDALLAAHDI